MAPDKVRRPFGAGRQRTTEKKSTSDIRSEAEYVRASIIGGNESAESDVEGEKSMREKDVSV